jgi:hypothetical protein
LKKYKLIFKFNTSLDLHECQTRLCKTTGINDLFYSTNGATIRGYVLGRWFYLWWQESIGLLQVKNSFSFVCVGKLKSKQNETVIHGYIGMHPLVMLFLFIWFGGLLAFGGLAIASIVNNADASHSGVFTLFFLCPVLVLMIVIGIMLVISGRIISGDDRFEIINFIKTTFNIDDSQ